MPSESGFLWPLNGYNTLTSLFGSRIHPITGKANNHTGIDIPAPAGTAILASKSGVVITSTRNRSYGNYVVVGHSDGTSTLYAHMSSRSVSQGQTVKQGQVVGRVGTHRLVHGQPPPLRGPRQRQPGGPGELLQEQDPLCPVQGQKSSAEALKNKVRKRVFCLRTCFFFRIFR